MLWPLMGYLTVFALAAQTAEQEYWKRKPELIRRATSELSNPDPEVRFQATNDLAQLVPEREDDPVPEGLLTLALPALIKSGRTDPAARVREGAFLAITALGPRAASAIPALTAALADGAPEVRQAAAMALGEIGPASRTAIRALARLLRETTPHVRWAAVVALGSIGSPEVVPHLRRALKDPDPGVRRSAQNALHTIEAPKPEEEP